MRTLYMYPNHQQAVSGFQDKLHDLYSKKQDCGFEVDYNWKTIVIGEDTYYYMSLHELKEIQFLDYDEWEFKGEIVPVYQDTIDFLNLNMVRH